MFMPIFTDFQTLIPSWPILTPTKSFQNNIEKYDVCWKGCDMFLMGFQNNITVFLCSLKKQKPFWYRGDQTRVQVPSKNRKNSGLAARLRWIVGYSQTINLFEPKLYMMNVGKDDMFWMGLQNNILMCFLQSPK